MKRSLTDYLGNGKADGSETPTPESAPPELVNPSDAAPHPEPEPEEDSALVLNAKWPNSVFKFVDICNYVPRFDATMLVRFSPEGVDIEGMDHSHVAKIHIHLDQHDFTKYTFRQMERIVPLDFKELAKKVKRFNKVEDEIAMTLDLTPMIAFECRGIHFCQKPADTDLDPPHRPNLEFKIACTTNLPDLIEVLEFASDHAEYVVLNTSEKGVRLEGSCADDDTEFHKALKVKDARLGVASNIYHVAYLLDILKITRTKFLDRQGVRLELADQMPLYITLKISDASFVTAYLAPRVEEEKPVEEKAPEAKGATAQDALSEESEGAKFSNDAEGEIDAQPLPDGEERSV
jgi:hypothetical protein